MENNPVVKEVKYAPFMACTTLTKDLDVFITGDTEEEALDNLKKTTS